MIFLFRKTKLFFLFSSSLWVVAVVIARLFLFTDAPTVLLGILYPIVFAVLGILILFIFASTQANRMHQALTDLLSDDCDPDAFLELYTPLYEQRNTVRVLSSLIASTYATGLFHSGKTEEALGIVKELEKDPAFQKQRPIDRAEVYVDIGIYSLANHDLPGTRNAIAEGKKILETLTVGTVDYNRLYRELLRLGYRADITEGKVEEALEYFMGDGRECKSAFSKVNRMNTLSQIYRQTGDIERLRSCLNYVRDNGGTLMMAKQAAEELALLPPAPEEECKKDEEE